MERIEGWQELVSKHLNWCDFVASVKYSKCYKWSLLDRDDFIQAARKGLVQMAKKYEPAKNTSFQAFAIQRVVGEIWDSIRRVEGRAKKSKKVDIEGNLIGGHKKMRSEVEVPYPQYSDDDRSMFQIVMKDDFHGTCNLLEHHLARLDLQRLLSKLNSRYQHVIYEYDIMGRKLKEIGADLGVNESRASQIHSLAMTKLRAAVAVA